MSAFVSDVSRADPPACACLAGLEAALNAVFDGDSNACPQLARDALTGALRGPSDACPHCFAPANGRVAEATAARMAAEPPAARHAHGRLNLDRIRSLLRPK